MLYTILNTNLSSYEFAYIQKYWIYQKRLIYLRIGTSVYLSEYLHSDQDKHVAAPLVRISVLPVH